MRVIWTDQAFIRLVEIEDYIAQDDPRIAARHTEHLITRSEALAEHPRLGRILPELPASELRELVEGNYRIVYRIREEQVEVLTVFEAHRLLPRQDLCSDPED